MLQEKEFEILACIESSKAQLTQRQIAKKTGYSIGTVNSTLAKLEESKLLNNSKITPEGLSALEPYRVKRIIFIAAGFGTRLVPITLNTPKPLVRVHGQRIIDSMIDTAIKAEIEEIYIVRGYLKEQFDQLLYKYPGIKFIDNPNYNETNNIGSAIKAKDYFSSAYICEADLIIKNPDLIKKYQYRSNYCGVKCERTDDWCLYSTKGKITGVSVGGYNAYRMVGISYWTEDDGKRLADCIQKVYDMPGGKEKYWDSVPLDVCKKEFNLYIRECSFDDFTEIDTFNELKSLDPSYKV
ncbi:MAG: winged helix-turn-helix transcriptional regulator [Treponema sp.]|nr:winged helix-turn-helix transcriptional regulator [Treponema sp.]